MTLFRSLPRSTFALPLVVLASQACIESGLKDDEEPPDSPEPNILVDPPAIGFPATPVGDEVLADFTVENVGDGALEVFDLAVVAGADVFHLVDDGQSREFTLAPGDSRSFQVAFRPVDGAAAFGAIVADSNDRDGDNSTVDLYGEGLTPNILVEPAEITFGELPAGGSEVQSYTVSNVGNANLAVTDMVLGALNPAFQIDWDGVPFDLAPGETLSFDVTYTSFGNDLENDQIQVLSNDPDGENSRVDLEGTGLGPDLEITPATFDFGQAFIPCGESVELTLENVGGDDLTITDATYDTPGGSFVFNPSFALPITLAPGETRVVSVDFLPTAVGADLGTLSVTSNDPDGVETAEQLGEGVWQGSNAETFESPEAPPVDVLITIDQSCSMSSDNTDDVEDGFPAFVQELQSVADWQLLLVTNPTTGCGTSGVLDDSVTNVENILVANAFNSAHDDNGGTNRTEKLLELADLALSKTGPGNCNEGFLRPGALLHIVTISDEAEQSGTSGASWVTTLGGYASDPTLLKISGVLDLYTSCGDGSGAAGYSQAVSLTGGASLDICDPSWGASFGAIGSEVLLGSPSYPLASQADPYSIVVEVNGVPTTDYIYDPASQVVTINSPVIGEGDTVDVTYNILATCN